MTDAVAGVVVAGSQKMTVSEENLGTAKVWFNSTRFDGEGCLCGSQRGEMVEEVGAAKR